MAQKLAGRAVVWGPQQKADIIHLNCGLYDIVRHHDAQKNRVPLTQYSENVELILTLFLHGAPAELFWATATPIDEERQHRVQSFYRFQDDIQAYNAEAGSIAGRLGVKINDLYLLMTESGPQKHLAEDGVHFTEDGYRLLGDAVADAALRILDVIDP